MFNRMHGKSSKGFDVCVPDMSIKSTMIVVHLVKVMVMVIVIEVEVLLMVALYLYL